MHPVHKEKYYVAKETFYHFMYDRHADMFKKEKRGHLIYAIIMAVAGTAVTAVNFISESAKGDMVWMILPLVFLFLCIALLMQYKKADKVAYDKIMKDYDNRKYADKQYSVKFYEDKMTYTLGSEMETISYNQFKKYYEGPGYFAMFFHTGDLVLFNGNCNVEKIKGILVNYKENLFRQEAEENATEETMDTVVEANAAEIME